MPNLRKAAAVRGRGSHRLRGFAAVLIVLLLGTAAFAQGGAWDLGPYQFVNGPSSGPLLARMGSGSLGSYGFVGKVGGVAFRGVAVPGQELASGSVYLVYDAGAVDGKRLSVRIGDAVYVQSLPDWLLVPIAKYADSNYNACVSLFGERTGKEFYDIVYHPAFQNTLLGLRLLQADILLFDIGHMWRLPAFEGKMPLGKGESPPEGLNPASAGKVTAALQNASFQSWVLTDQAVSVRFTAGAGQMHLTGEPYYHFWVSDFEGYSRAYEALAGQANTLRAAGDVARYNRVAAQINALEPRVSEVRSLTSALKSIGRDLRRLNPAVYDAATATMRYAAFFRYVKQTNPPAWTEFLKRINTAQPEPKVVTPTAWRKPK